MSAFNQNMSKFGQLSDDAGVFRATKAAIAVG
jgi:hypothetical protein